MRKIYLPLVVLMLALLWITMLSTASADEPVQVTKQVLSVPPKFDDADWPIVKVEKWKYRDPETGQIHLRQRIFRESPVPTHSTGPCDRTDSSNVTIAATCTYRGAVSQTDQDTSGGVTANMKHYADKYCTESECYTRYYRMTKVELWWTRSSSSQSVWNATLLWGCNWTCFKCEDGSGFSYVYQDGPFTPTWNGNTSYLYRYTATWPILKGVGDVTVVPGARSDSSSSGGPLHTETFWNQPY